MQFLATGAAATATAMAISLSYAQPAHIQAQHVNAPEAGMEVTQMISRPKLPVEIAINLKYIFDHDLLLQGDFFSGVRVEEIFNATEVKVINTDEDAKKRSNVSATKFDAVFPRAIATEVSSGSIKSATLWAGKTLHDSGLVTAGLNFSMKEGGPNFSETQRIFGADFALVPSRPFMHGGPLPATALHGNEAWVFRLVTGEIKRDITLGFNRAGELSAVIIGINQD
jgi:hypothetical protein